MYQGKCRRSISLRQNEQKHAEKAFSTNWNRIIQKKLLSLNLLTR